MGKFITFEGTDGSGKTTVIKRIEEELNNRGYKVIVTREPGGVSISEQIRDILHDNKNTMMDRITEAMLYAASRRQHLIEKVKPYLEKDYIVLCDRYIDSSLAYQGYARGIGIDKVKEINDYATEGFYPDLTLFIDVSPEVGLKRIYSHTDTHEVNRMDNESRSFHERTHEGYLILLDMFKDRIIRINGERSVEEVVNDSLNQILEKINA